MGSRKSNRRSKLQIIDITTIVGPKYGYQDQGAARTGRRDRAARGADPLAAVGPHRRRPDGRARQPPARRRRASSSGSAASAGQQGQAALGHGVGGRHIFPADRDGDDHVYCTFEFPGKGYYKDDHKTGKVADPNKKIVVTYSSINGNGFGGYGESVMGTKGTLILEHEQDVMLFEGSATTTRIEVKERRQAGAGHV